MAYIYIAMMVTTVILHLESIILALELDGCVDFVVSSYNKKCHKPQPELRPLRYN